MFRTERNKETFQKTIQIKCLFAKYMQHICIFLGSRRPSLASVHSTSSSIKSYSMVRIEKELQQKELRQEMKLRLARLQQQQQIKPHIIISDPLLHGVISKSSLPSPSPITPNSTDELLPSVDEAQEVYCIKFR